MKEASLSVYVDSSWANGPNRRSVCGYFVLANKQVVHYKSKVQDTVTLSSTEAEYYALSHAVKDAQWIRNILMETGIKIRQFVTYCDNQAAIKIAHSQEGTAKTKHMDVRLQFLKEYIKDGRIELKYVSTEANLADSFTKALTRNTFEKLAKPLFKSEVEVDR